MQSDDPDFEPKATDVIGLYVNPPQHAAVFAADEKTAIQALDRLDPVLPRSPGRAERHGFEYYRHGTLSLFAALDTRSGEVLAQTVPRHTSAAFVEFLGDIGLALRAVRNAIAPPQKPHVETGRHGPHANRHILPEIVPKMVLSLVRAAHWRTARRRRTV
jgi:hypothetical protein